MQSNEDTQLIGQSNQILETNTFASKTNAALRDITEGISTYSSSITDSMRASKELNTETGSPLILTYRLSQAIPNYINVDIKCCFRWLDCSKKKITITLPLPSQIKAPSYTQKNIFVSESALPSELSMLGAACYDLFFWTSSTMQSVLSEAEQAQGVDKKNIELYFSAYKLAINDAERVRVIECLVNRYGKYYEYLISSSDFQRQAPDAKDKMMYYLNCLPNNYQSVSESANEIYLKYYRIFELLSEQKTDEAWVLFDPYTKLSPFIVHAFPHINVIKHFLHVIFRISGHDRYYGLDELLFIPEHDIIFSTHAELLKASNLLTFDIEQQTFIQRYAMAPLASLLKAGAEEALTASQETVSLRRAQEIARTREHITNRLSMPSYRSVYEDIDAQEDPVVEELSEFSSFSVIANSTGRK